MKGLYKILLLVIVPLLVAFGIGSFAYNNSTGYFLSWYIDDTGYKATEEEMGKYIDFYSDAYDVYYTEEVKMFNDELDKDVKLFDLTVYRWFEVEFDDDNQLNKKSIDLKYSYVLSNINYGNVYYSIYERSDKQHRFEYLPTFTINISDLGDEDEENRDEAETQFADNSDVKLYDYNFVGYTDDNGEETKRTYSGVKISTPSTKWAAFPVEDKFTSNIKVVISATDSQFPSEEDATIEVYTKEFSDYNQKSRDLEYDSATKTFKFAGKELEKGYDNDIYAAGYFKYVFKKTIWWQFLLALVLTLVVTGSTVIVWEAEAKKEKEEMAKREAKKNKKK